jgi:glycosyltransferase involved in cell wall biosynthesis
MAKKLKLLFQTDSSLAKTGFGRNAKAVLSHLYNTGKYDITHYCIGVNYSNPELKRTPWKSVGCLPDSQQEVEQLNRDPNVARLAGYGSHYLDKVIKDTKPDVYIAVQDIWGVDFAVDKIWFNKINSAIWTTLDSLPILPTAIEKAQKIKNYWVWSNFATKALNDLGHKHVSTLEGAIDQKEFFRLEDKKRKELRTRFGLREDFYVAGFVFRNQLRKSVPNLLEGFSLFLKKNKGTKAFLLLHTSWAEGWNIHRLAGEYGVPQERILTTYLCKACGNYHVMPFVGQEQPCPYCGEQKGMATTGVGFGITEEQLNEVYNLMDVYVHPFTSGGQEIPVQEAKLTELITCVTDYSCGEDLCEQGSGSLRLNWHEYREHGTEFRKASTDPKSICNRLEETFKMNSKKRRSLEKKARQWTIDKFSVDTIGGKLEKFLDSCEPTDYDFSLKEEERDPNFVIPDIESDSDWLVCMYHNLLKMKHVTSADEGHKYWMRELAKGAKRDQVERYFRQVAAKENAQQLEKSKTIESFIDENDGGKRILYVMPESSQDVFMSTSLFRSMKESYPDHKLYVSTNQENFEILDANPYVHSVMPYTQQMDQIFSLQGTNDHDGFFDMAFLPYFTTQRNPTYSHNALDKIAYKDLKYEK